MYQVSIFNNGIETIIHTPNPDNDAPHLNDMNLKIVENQSGIFGFKIYINHDSYGALIDLVTKVTITDLSNNKIKYEGRILLSVELMDSSGIFYKDVVCESELGYLNDSRVGRWELHPSELPNDAPSYAEGYYTIKSALQKIINNHNANVEADKRFILGNVEADDGVYFATNYESSLEILLTKIINNNGLVISIRKDNGVRYLDILFDNPVTSSTKITLRKNLKEFKKTPDYSTFCTRLIAVGADGMTFEDINNGKDYVEDLSAIEKFGIITKPYEWKDVTLKENLLQKAQEKLAAILNDSYVSVEVSALDLSYIGLTPEEFEISTKYIIENDVQNYSNALKLVAINLGLSDPWNSKLTFSNLPVSAISNSIGIQQQVNSNRIEVLTYNGKLIQKISNTDGALESYREQTDAAILERVKSTEFESYKEQTPSLITDTVRQSGIIESVVQQSPSEVQVAFNSITGNVQNSGGKFSIINGSLNVKNGNNEVVIDGQYNMFKIIVSGTIALNFSSGVYETLATITHGLGYKPAFVIYGEDTPDGTSGTLPGFAVENMSDDYLGFRELHSANVTASEFTISYRRALSNQNTSGTLKYKYYLMKEAAI